MSNLSIANTSALLGFALMGNFPVNDNQIGLAAGTQANATPLMASLTRAVQGAANASFQLKSILSGEAGAQTLVVVVNDTPGAIVVFPAVGERQNGVANASLSIPSGNTGIFIKVPVWMNGGLAEWRSNVVA